MEPSTTRVFFVTANIASCFEQPKEMLNPWLDEFFKAVVDHDPKFIALHCQEVGGKNYETSMTHVDEFIKNLTVIAKRLHFSRARIFLDEDFTSAERFTALGNIYLIHDSVKEALIWNFREKCFVECQGIDEYVGDIEDVPLIEKAKFPQEFFPECKWSRKGFIRTRWRLGGTIFDLVNIHLFHDASNFIAMEQFPSVYTLNRKRAMEHTLDRFHNDEYENVPFFIFGDFNFRLDTGGVVQTLTGKCSKEEIEISGEKTCEYKDQDGKTLLSMSKKGFRHSNHHSLFLRDGSKWLRPFDKELSHFSERLSEFPITFHPSYPFEEGVNAKVGYLYMQTRCPSWCDRVILSKAAKDIVEKSGKEVKYNLIGFNTNMGDHKPVGLRLELPQEAGIVRCCSLEHPCPNFVHNPSALCFTASAWCYCLDYPKCPGNVVRPSDNDAEVKLARSDLTKVLLRDHACHKERQCVCSTETNNGMAPCISASDKTGKILKNILNLKSEELMSTEKQDSFLKRVHSDPVKVRNVAQKQMAVDLAHSLLAHSHSLDSEYKGKTIKLRLRATSSRLISHHSSSSEEWFEEVVHKEAQGEQLGLGGSASEDVEEDQIPFPSLDAVSLDNPSTADTRELSFLSEDSSATLVDLYYSKKPMDQDYSLNNLLLSDSFEGHLDEIDSVSKSSAGMMNKSKLAPSESDLENSVYDTSTRKLQPSDSASGRSNGLNEDRSKSPSNKRCCCGIS